MKRTLAASSILLLLPTVAFADILPRVAGFFNIFVGLMLVAAFLCMGTGMLLWVVRLSTYPTYRDEGILLMMWGVAILFVLLVLLAIVQFIQFHAAAASFVFGIIILIAVAWFVIAVLMAKEEKKEEY
ncbi:MAG: hypothetical protein WC050_01035 [Candidatus Paceibacterota bacterium]